MGRILLLRHGETDWNRTGRIQGWEDVPLNDRGRKQARAAAQFIADRYPALDRVLSSDLPRAVETAAAVTSLPPFDHLTVERDSAWRERDFGVYQGRESEAFFEDNPEFAVVDGHEDAKANVPEEGESYEQFRERVRTAWADLTRGLESTVLVVTHSGVIRAIIASVEDDDIETVLTEYDVENCSVTEVVVDGDTRLDVTTHVPNPHSTG